MHGDRRVPSTARTHKLLCASDFQVSAYVTLAVDTLAKASYKAKPRVSVEREYPRWGIILAIFAHSPPHLIKKQILIPTSQGQ